MERLDNFFWFESWRTAPLPQTDNLSKDLQGTKVAAVSGQGLALANLTKETLAKMPSDQSFDHFYANISRKRESLLGKPRFQESDVLRADWRLVLVHQAIPKLPKITLEGSIMRVFILSSGYLSPR